jgi:hypothetical protein
VHAPGGNEIISAGCTHLGAPAAARCAETVGKLRARLLHPAGLALRSATQQTNCNANIDQTPHPAQDSSL